MQRAFLRKCEAAVGRIADGMAGPFPQAERHALAHDLLIRLVFLHLAGSPPPERRHLYRTALMPMLYTEIDRNLATESADVLRDLLPVPKSVGRDATRIDIDDSLLRPIIGEGGLLTRRPTILDQRPDPATDHGTLAALVEYLGGDRRERGAYYTPLEVVACICREVLARGRTPKAVLDPACGGGEFLIGMYRAAREIPAVEAPEVTLYGIDLDPRAVGVTRLRLWLESRATGSRGLDADTLKGQIRVGDALAEHIEIGGRRQWDIIVTNPPYGVKASLPARDRLFDPRTEGMQSRDAYGLFVARTLGLLNDEGVAGLVIPETWRTIRSHRPLRKRVLTTSRIELVAELPGATFDATVGPEILLLRKGFPGEDHCILAVDGRGTPPLPLPDPGGRWTAGAGGATYRYPQVLCSRHPSSPIFVGSAELFRLLLDPDLVRLGDIASVRHGLTTGATQRFVYANAAVSGRYRKADPKMIIPAEELRHLSDDERQNGIDPEQFGGRYLVPYDKGGGSRMVDGWLPCYWIPTEYYIDWGKSSVATMKQLPGFRHDGRQFYFRPGITFSHTGQYAPTFRLGSSSVFDTAGSTLFTDRIDLRLLLAILNSTTVRYLFRAFINNSVNVAENPLKEIPLPHMDVESTGRLLGLVDDIVAKQRMDRYYPFRRMEQPEIDRIVYNLYGLTCADRTEIERWHTRCYPRLYGAT